MSEDTKSKSASSEEDSSEFSLELVVDKSKEEASPNEGGIDANLYDFDLDTIKDKPWLKPGADITDYFNYGFTEKTWKKYCDMQRENRAFVEREGNTMEWGQGDSRYQQRQDDSRYQQRQDDRYGKRRRMDDDERYNRNYRRY